MIKNRILRYSLAAALLGGVPIVHQAYAQETKPIINASLTGTVIDAISKQPLEGVTIQLDAVTHSVKTDRNGHFQFVTGQKLPFKVNISFVGYEKQSLVIDKSPAVIELQPTTADLDEVVVVGYGTQRKRDLTGAVGSLPESLLKQQLSSLDQALKGGISGVQVTQTSGQPGGGVSVRIRGGASIQGGNEPLYVIDGFPVYNQTESTGVGSGTALNPLASINPADIESIEVLKDASATAIYGSRGANGVVIVSTKKGTRGRAKLSFDGNRGTQGILKKIDVLAAQDFAKLRNEVLYDSNPTLGQFQYLSAEEIDNLGEGTDWQDAAFRTANVQSHQLSLSGGSENVQYFVAANYYDQEGIIVNTDFKRLGFRSNIQAQPYKRLQIAANLSVNRTNAQIAPSGIVNSLLIMPPTATIYEADGSYTLRNPFENIFANPIATLLETTNQQVGLRTIGTSFAQYELLDGLHVKVLLGADLNNSTDKYYLPSYIYEGSGNNGQAKLGNLDYYSWLNENTINYNKTFNDKHNLDVLVGFTQQEAKSEVFGAGAENFVTDELLYNDLSSGSTLLRPTSGSYKWVLHSYLSRINYNYANKYYVSASIRRDGSSRFGANNKWGNFPSVALSWRPSQEEFLQSALPFIDDLKLRTSFGTTGNLEIGQYQSLSTLYALNYLIGGNILTGFASQRIPNADLGWETTYQYDAGLDIELLNRRLQLSVDWYYKKTEDLLLNVEIPWTSGYASSLQNFGSVQNKGAEITIRSQNLVGNFKWNSDLNLSFNRNKVLSIGSGASYITGNYIIEVGQPLGTFYGTVTDGILQIGEESTKGTFTGNATPKAGDRLYKDIDGDGTFTTADDRTIIGNAQPDFIFGFTNNFQYKGFDLNLLFQGSIGNELLNINRQNLEMFTGQQNASIDALQRWTETNPSQTYPRAKLDPAPVFSDQFVEDGSFVRLKSLQLGYTLPKIWTKNHIDHIRLYLVGQNLLTWTAYTGFDPEVTSGNNVQIGTDAGIYPASKSLSFGISVNF